MTYPNLERPLSLLCITSRSVAEDKLWSSLFAVGDKVLSIDDIGVTLGSPRRTQWLGCAGVLTPHSEVTSLSMRSPPSESWLTNWDHSLFKYYQQYFVLFYSWMAK